MELPPRHRKSYTLSLVLYCQLKLVHASHALVPSLSLCLYWSLAPDSERTLNATLTTFGQPSPGRNSWRVDRYFIGLTPLNDPDDANVDIVAVTGVGGHALGSFRSDDGSAVWLRDFAPQETSHERASLRMSTTLLSSRVTTTEGSTSWRARFWMDSPSFAS